MTRANIDWSARERDIPIGHSIGMILGKTAGGIIETIKNPAVGVSQVAGLGKGFFEGIQDGMEVTAANFEIAKARGKIRKVKKSVLAWQKTHITVAQQAHEIKDIIEGLPEDVREELQDLYKEENQDQFGTGRTPAPAGA